MWELASNIFTVMPRRNDDQRSLAIGMLRAGIHIEQVAVAFGVHRTTIPRLRDKFANTANVKDRPRLGQPRKLPGPFGHCWALAWQDLTMKIWYARQSQVYTIKTPFKCTGFITVKTFEASSHISWLINHRPLNFYGPFWVSVVKL